MGDRNADEFFILSLRWTRGESLTWWCPNNSGYTIVLEQAGRYSHSAVDGNPVLATKHGEPSDVCDACGNAPRQTVLGLRVVGEVSRG